MFTEILWKALRESVSILEGKDPEIEEGNHNIDKWSKGRSDLKSFLSYSRESQKKRRNLIGPRVGQTTFFVLVTMFGVGEPFFLWVIVTVTF